MPILFAEGYNALTIKFLSVARFAICYSCAKDGSGYPFCKKDSSVQPARGAQIKI